MAGGKETPRQRMMGILYLVLLGLIALEVPENLLDSFKNIADSLTSSKANVTTGINTSLSAFEATKLKQEPERAKVPYEKAQKAKKLVDDLDTYIESLKKQLATETGGISPSTGDYAGRDNLDATTDLMTSRRKNAYDLHKKIDVTRNGLLSLLDPKDTVGIKLSLEAIAPKPRAGFEKKDWENANFGEGIPVGASMTSFIKIQADAKNSENEIIKKILGKVDQAQVNLDQFNAVAVAPTSYVLVGQPYTADVFLTASDSHASPEITVNGSPLHVQDGKGKYDGDTHTPGLHTWNGSVKVKQTDGTFKTYPLPAQTYMVAQPSAVVKPDKMNVLYIGVPNPVSISAPGIATEKLKVSMQGGSITKSGSGYTVMVSSIGKAAITVSGDLAPGKTSVLGTSEFRVKRIPDPKPQFAGKSGGNTSAANIKAQDRLFAKLDNFDFDAKFNVTRFTILVVKPRQDPQIYSTQGAELTPQMRSALSSIAPGATVVFKDIVAVGPDGTQRGLDPIVLSAN